jgi:hypothetical protein
VTDIGHDAKRRGFTGGGWQFWLVVIAKFAMLATVMGGAVGGFVWTWFKVAMPAAKARQVAQHLVDNAQRQADQAAVHEKSALARAQEIEKATVQAKITLAELRIVLDSTGQSIVTARQELADLKAERSAIAQAKAETNLALSAAFSRKTG